MQLLATTAVMAMFALPPRPAGPGPKIGKPAPAAAGLADMPHHQTADSAAAPSEADTVTACQDFFEYVRERYQYVLDGGWGKRPSTFQPQTTDSIVQAVVARVEGTPRRVLEEARRMAPTTSDPAVRVVGYFYNSCLVDTMATAHGRAGGPERTEFCVATTRERLGAALDQLSIKQAISPVAMAAAQQMIETLNAAAGEWVGGLSWLTPAAKQGVQGTFRKMKFPLMGVPDTWPDYTNFRLTPTDFAANSAAVTAAEAAAEAAHMPKGWARTPFSSRIDQDGWTPFWIWAQGSPPGMISPGLVAPPLFDPAADAASNYGAIGVIIAHELMHNFGNRLTGDDSVAYRTRVRQFDAAAGSFSEHFEDGVGLFVAYKAFQRANPARPGPTIGGRTPEQRFFIMFANGLAYLYQATPGRFGSNNLARLRVNLAVSTTRAFALAFGCKTGDAMVGAPEQQVERVF